MRPLFDHRTESQGGRDRHDRDPARQEQDRQARNQLTLVRFATLLAVATFIASSAPAALFAASFSSFLFLFSIGSALTAGLAREPLTPDFLTRWDQAAGLMALSLFAKLFVDPEVVRQAAAAAGVG